MKTLVLGGIKSGKSRYAEALALSSDKRSTLIATATALDKEMTERIKRHQQTRSAEISVVEEPILLGQAINECSNNECVLIDCLTLWITNLLMVDDNYASLIEQRTRFLSAVQNSDSQIIIVSNETNMGIVPLGELSRRYADEIGLIHQELAGYCDNVVLMVAGLPLHIKQSPAL